MGLRFMNSILLTVKKHQIEIDLSDKNDVGETAIFETEYVKSLMLMRWIRRSIENGTLVEI